MAGSSGRIVAVFVAMWGFVGAFHASAAEAPPGWRHTMFIYAMGAGIDGDAQIGPVEVEVDASMSDVFSALEFGGMLAYRADNGTWSFTGDATFMGLGASETSEGGLLNGEMDVDQWTLMGTVGRRWTDHLEFLFGLAYVDLAMDLSLKSTDGGRIDLAAGRDASWIDPTVGLQYNRPLGERWQITLRGDVGGFGIGSDFMYHLLASARWQASEHVGVFFGYRLIAFDYEDGDDLDYQRYDLTEQGPLLGMSISF